MNVRAFCGGAFGENGYLLVADDGSAVAVDPGAASAGMADAIAREGLTLHAVLLTHAHLDHVEGIHRIRAVAPDAPLWLHPDDRPLYEALPEQARAFGMAVEPQPDPDQWFDPPSRFEFGGEVLEVRFAPGHAPGHVILHSERHGLALVGDVVFQGSIGRTDLPGGDLRTLMASIRGEILTLPDDTVLHPGHGPATTVGRERGTNPFLVPHFGGELA